jgi:multidrug efflux system membrane fusion protein
MTTVETRDAATTHDRPVTDAPPRRARRWLVGGALVVAIGAAIGVVRARGGTTARGAPPAADRVGAVSIVPVTQRDVPIVLEGLGNAVPLATVTVKTQVDGRLDRVLFKEGDAVKRGDLLAQVDARPFAIQRQQAEAGLARDQAQLRNLQLNLERYKTLRGQNLIPQQQVDDQQAQADQLAATVMNDQALVASARLNIDYARITSPIDGVTGVRQVDPGNIVHPGDASGIVVITQLDPIAVVFTLPQDDIPRVSKQLAAGPMTVEAYARDGVAKLATGQLALIDNQVNVQTATIRLKATFPNGDRALWPNAFVKARLLLTTRKGATVVPAAVVQRGPQGTYCYVALADDTVTLRPNDVDTIEGDWAIVARGLQPGERVVTDGQSQLRQGAKIAPRAADGGQAHAAADAGAAPGPTGRKGRP